MKDNLKEQLLRIVRIEDVISRYIRLKRGGSSENTLIGICPFHDDHHPSLRVNTKEQYYKCFSCGEGGDAFKFVQKIENCSFPEALKRMAGWYGLTRDILPSSVPSRVPVAPRVKVVPVWDEDVIEDFMDRHYEIACSLTPCIHATPQLTETCLRFGVGLAPEWMPRGFGFLRNRLVFPICNEGGEVIAFSGRYQGDAKKDGVAKYINSATSAVYRKGEILYGLYQSEEAIRKHHFVYITEGYKDVLAMHAAGFSNTVGLCGTALTDEHIKLLSRHTNRIVLLLDGDQAGCQASDEAACRLRRAGFIVSQIFLSPEQDPDSLQSELGIESFVRYIREATCYSRLEAYEYYLVACLNRFMEKMKQILTLEERLVTLPEIIKVRRRLARVTEKLGHGAVCMEI